MVRCRRCGLVYTNPRPRLTTLTSSYEEEYAVEHQDPELLRLRRRMYEVERREILHLLSVGRPSRSTGTSGATPGLDRKRFLDVGCGTGEFLSLIRGDFDVYGVDVSRTYVQHGREHLGLANLREGQLSEAGFASDFFDVIQMRGVLQHLPDPLAQLREAWRVLKPGGLLVISATPNITSPAARCFGASFRLLAPDQMLYSFSPTTLIDMLAKAGFAGQRFSFPYLSTPYCHWWDGASFVALLLWLTFRRATGGDTNAIKSPPFPRSMMTCYTRKPQTTSL